MATRNAVSEELRAGGNVSRHATSSPTTGPTITSSASSRSAAVVHCHFTFLVMGLCTAFRLWQAKSTLVPTAQTAVHPNLSTALLGGEGTARWRQRLREENRDKILVFIGQAYGIFHLAEFAILTHVPLRRLPSALGSPQAVLQRFGLSP